MCRGHAQYTAFAPIPLLLLQALQKWQVFLVSLYLLSVICPNWACMQLFLVPYNIFCILLLEEWCARCKHCNTAVKGLRSVCLSKFGGPMGVSKLRFFLLHHLGHSCFKN